MQSVCSVILAAGDGKRMKSKYPKVLSEVLFHPMIRWVTDSAAAAGIADSCAVLGGGGDLVRQALPPGTATVTQTERRGTGHAVMMARPFLEAGDWEHVLVLYGDAPFVSPEDIRASYEQHIARGSAVTLFAARVEQPAGYGRVVSQSGQVLRIVEEADADEETRAIRDINAGTYWFRRDFLLEGLGRLTCDNAQGEYYLPDLIAIAIQMGLGAGVYQAHPDAALGANDRRGLAQLNEIARRRAIDRHREEGVDIPFEDGVVLGREVSIGPDTQILPGTILKGRTRIGSDCVIGPNSHLDNATIEDGCTVISSYIDSSLLEEGVKLGPMANIRPNCRVGRAAKIGDFVELKNSNIGAETSVAHLTYIGDSDVGEKCNFGCGVVTVNYDGNNKHRTTIGNGVFVGCNTNLVAPVTMEDGSYSAAGTTVTEHVPKDSLAIGRARQVTKENWVRERGLFRR